MELERGSRSGTRHSTLPHNTLCGRYDLPFNCWRAHSSLRLTNPLLGVTAEPSLATAKVDHVKEEQPELLHAAAKADEAQN